MPKKDFLGVEVYKLKPVFRDKRGEIFDIVEERVGHVGMVTFARAGIVRASHYHKRSVQYQLVLSGKIKMTVQDLSGRRRKSYVMGPNTFALIPPRVIHTLQSVSPAVLLDLTTLSRKNGGYEKDTVRVPARER